MARAIKLVSGLMAVVCLSTLASDAQAADCQWCEISGTIVGGCAIVPNPDATNRLEINWYGTFLGVIVDPNRRGVVTAPSRLLFSISGQVRELGVGMGGTDAGQTGTGYYQGAVEIRIHQGTFDSNPIWSADAALRGPVGAWHLIYNPLTEPVVGTYTRTTRSQECVGALSFGTQPRVALGT